MGIPESNVTCAFDAIEAMNRIAQNLVEHLEDPSKQLFSLIITDFNVPNGSAIEILVNTEQILLKANKPYPKVIMLTALDDPSLKTVFF
jgi:CheY-like chemotaxis protein